MEQSDSHTKGSTGIRAAFTYILYCLMRVKFGNRTEATLPTVRNVFLVAEGSNCKETETQILQKGKTTVQERLLFFNTSVNPEALLRTDEGDASCLWKFVFLVLVGKFTVPSTETESLGGSNSSRRLSSRCCRGQV